MRFEKKIVLLVIIALVVAIFPVMAAVSTEVKGSVLEVQKYGNLTMDIEPLALYDAGYELGDILLVKVGENELEIPFCTSYSDVDTGSMLVRDDQGKNLLVVAINMGNFSTTYEVEAGDELIFSMIEKGGYLSEYLLHQLERTNERADYATDAVFANFRNINTTGMEANVLFRSSSPVNNELNRASYSNELMEYAKIETVINLADSKEEIEGYYEVEDFNSNYYKSLYDNGKVIYLDMGVDLSSSDFETKLAEGFKFIINNEGPYLVHCTEGKDRAGFASAVLESLMGASLNEIVTDYMVTYKNYYGVEEGTEQYDAIAESNIVTSLTTIVSGLEKGTDISRLNLQKAAEMYLLKIGLTLEEINQLKNNLATAELTEEVVESENYIVVSGDNLWDIALKYLDEGERYNEIFEMNKTIINNPDLIFVGQELIMPTK
ncbi:tyrosine-protein phosphatase [Clostridiaceae bacterium HSG29]|nr:tyrosine-protein phosphatase [Clostridiaceae bacterium HSG29]